MDKDTRFNPRSQEDDLIFFRNIVERASTIILKLDSRGTITYVNEYGLRFFRYERDELIGKNMLGTIVPEIDSSGRNLGNLVAELFENTDQYATNENENIRGNGTRVWVHWMNSRILDEQGNVREILCVGNDATVRKHVEAALEEERHFLRELSDAIPNPLYYKDIDGRFLMCNRAFERYSGFSSEEIIGKTVYDIFPPDVAELCHIKDLEIIRSGGVRTFEASLPDPGGGELAVVFNKAPHTDRDGNMIGFVGIITDITAQKKAELQSAEQEEALNIILKNLPAAVLLIDAANHRIVGVNEAALRLLDLHEEDVVGEHCSNFICHASGLRCPALEAGGITNEECTLTVGSGESLTTIPILKSASSIRIRGHDMILESFADLSGEKKLENERMRHAKLVTALELAGAASHELNQPLQIIAGYAGVLGYQVPEASEEAKKTVEEILAQVRRMGDILWKLTHLTSYETRDYAGSEQIVDLDKSSAGAEEE